MAIASRGVPEEMAVTIFAWLDNPELGETNIPYWDFQQLRLDWVFLEKTESKSSIVLKTRNRKVSAG